MFSPFTHKAGATQGVSHFAACKVQYLDAPAAGGLTDTTRGVSSVSEVEANEPARLSVMKPREARKYGGTPALSRRLGMPPVSTAKRSPGPSAPLPGSKLLKAWRAARK